MFTVFWFTFSWTTLCSFGCCLIFSLYVWPKIKFGVLYIYTITYNMDKSEHKTIVWMLFVCGILKSMVWPSWYFCRIHLYYNIFPLILIILVFFRSDFRNSISFFLYLLPVFSFYFSLVWLILRFVFQFRFVTISNSNVKWIRIFVCNAIAKFFIIFWYCAA